MRLPMWGAVVCVVAFVASSVKAEEVDEALLFMDIPVVVTATLTEKSCGDVPAAVTVLTEKEIKASGASTLADILNRVSGIDVAYSARKLICMRGIRTQYNDKFKLLIDGHAFDDTIWYYDIDLAGVKRIEIVRGPGSALYGTGAFAGTINVITKQPEDIDGTEIDIKYGAGNTGRGSVACGKASGEQAWGARASYRGVDGPNVKIDRDKYSGYPFSLTTAGPATVRDVERAHEAAVTYACKGFSVNASLSRTDHPMLLAETGAITQENEYVTVDYGYVEAKYDRVFSPDTSLKTKASYDNYRTRAYGQLTPYGFTTGLDGNRDGIIDYWPSGVHAEYGVTTDDFRAEAMIDHKPFSGNELLFGGFVQQAQTRDIYIKSEAHPVYYYPSGGMVDYDASANWLKAAKRVVSGVFFQDEWTLSKRVYAILGGRYDHYDDVGDALTPRAGIIWKLAEQDTVKLLYGQAFRAPSFRALYTQNNAVIVGNAALKPETMDSAELTYIGTHNNLETTVTVYAAQTNNLTVPSVDRLNLGLVTPMYWVNNGKSNHYGIEWNEKYVFQRDNYVYAGYTFTSAKDDATGDNVPFVPELQASFGWNMTCGRKVNWNVNLDLTDRTRRETGDTSPAIAPTAVVDTSVRYLLARGLTLSFTVNNLTDETVVVPATLNYGGLNASDIPRPGTTYMGGVEYKF